MAWLCLLSLVDRRHWCHSIWPQAQFDDEDFWQLLTKLKSCPRAVFFCHLVWNWNSKCYDPGSVPWLVWSVEFAGKMTLFPNVVRCGGKWRWFGFPQRGVAAVLWQRSVLLAKGRKWTMAEGPLANGRKALRPSHRWTPVHNWENPLVTVCGEVLPIEQSAPSCLKTVRTFQTYQQIQFYNPL